MCSSTLAPNSIKKERENARKTEENGAFVR